jgi:hypothetical protein
MNTNHFFRTNCINFYLFYVECLYEDGKWGVYANSTDEYWMEMRNRQENYNISNFLEFIDIWNKSTSDWMRIYDNNTQESDLFR